MQIEYLTTIDSTNSELMRRAASGDYRAVCLVAREQTAGRGRLGRAWLSDTSSLMMSVGLPLAPQNWSGLSLAVGVCIAECLHPAIQIKWPNDLWIGGKKLAGILIETVAMPVAAARYVVVGIGINLEAPASDPTIAMKTMPCGLRDVLPEITTDATTLRILQPLLDTLSHFEQHGWKPYAQRFAARDALQGLPVALSSSDAQVARGRYAGVGLDGALQLQTDDGLKSFISHEVSVCF
jgi:BirA family biotin operon repressor/biotin-[acetyl-CoA-carboxylase] ligase